MKNFKLIKQYLGVALVGIGLLGGLMAALFLLHVDVPKTTMLAFTSYKGAASNVSFLFAGMTFSGAWLLASIDD